MSGLALTVVTTRYAVLSNSPMVERHSASNSSNTQTFIITLSAVASTTQTNGQHYYYTPPTGTALKRQKLIWVGLVGGARTSRVSLFTALIVTSLQVRLETKSVQ